MESLIINRLDVEFALQTGSPTLFRSDALVHVDGISGDSCFTEDQIPTITPRLSRIMLSIVSFARLLNTRERDGQTKLDPLSYTATLVSLLYRLIEFAPLGQSRSIVGEPYDDMVHLTMLAFMTTLLPNFGSDSSSHLLSDLLESAIQKLHIASADNQNSEFSLLLWTLFIGGISVLKRKDHRRLILQTCEHLDLNDWPTVHRQLCVFPWIHALHDLPGQYLWEDAQRRSNEILQECLQPEI